MRKEIFQKFQFINALLWYSIVKAYIEFSLELFVLFIVGLVISGIVVVYLLKKWLTSFWPDF